MYRPRSVSLLLRLWIVLSLALAPFLASMSVHAVDAAPTTVAAADHAQHMAAMSHGDHVQLPYGDMQHDHCQGPCCTSCVHCAGFAGPVMGGSGTRVAVLTPREPRFFSFAFIPLRERPPRVLAA